MSKGRNCSKKTTVEHASPQSISSSSSSRNSEQQCTSVHAEATTNLTLSNVDSISQSPSNLPTPTGLNEHHIIHLYQYTFGRAFIQNAALMAINISTFSEKDCLSPWTLSNPYPTIAPHSLSPTPLQLMTPHHPYVDLLAPVGLRESILRARLETLCNYGLCMDLYLGGFTVWGGQPWNSFGEHVPHSTSQLPSMNCCVS